MDIGIFDQIISEALEVLDANQRYLDLLEKYLDLFENYLDIFGTNHMLLLM